MKISTTLWLSMFLLMPMTHGADFSLKPFVTHPGTPDGSAGVPVGNGWFIGACDEDNTLRLFRSDAPEPPKILLDLNPLLGFPPKEKNKDTGKDKSKDTKKAEYRECDLEGAARIGDRIYWIGSHGRNSEGKERKERQVLFATQIERSGADTVLTLAGKPFTGLISALTKEERFKRFNLDDAAKKTPKDPGGLNIESLCAADGKLLIGFRNPIPEGRALLIPLNNPEEVISKGGAPLFGDPILLDLQGLGIRDMTRWNGGYLIVAGDYLDGTDDGAKRSKLVRWSGEAKVAPVDMAGDLGNLNPEAILSYGQDTAARLQLLSDDGGASFRSTFVEMLSP